MANRKVSLVWHCKTPDGWRRYPAVVGRNGRVRPAYGLVDGNAIQFPTGHYELRSYAGKKLVYENVGENAADAMTALNRKTKLLTARSTASEAGVKVIEEAGRTSLTKALGAFVQATQDKGSLVAAKAYALASGEFLAVVERQYADEVTAEDFAKHQRALRQRGCSGRTIANRHQCVVAFCRFAGVSADEIPKHGPKFEQKMPDIYSPEQLQAFFKSLSSDHHRLTFGLALQCGLREQELMYLTWADIDFRQKTLMVRSKLHLGFAIKDKEERGLPLSDGLLEMLTAAKDSNPGRVFVTGTRSDKPNTKLLRTLKRLVNHAGMNCGVCESCVARNECAVWFLHKFRATYATTMLRNGLDLSTVQRLLGHSDLASTLRYLRPAEGSELQAKMNAIAWAI